MPNSILACLIYFEKLIIIMFYRVCVDTLYIRSVEDISLHKFFIFKTILKSF